jgi:hypothetical protein
MKKPKLLLILLIYLLTFTFGGLLLTTDYAFAEGTGGDPPQGGSGGSSFQEEPYNTSLFDQFSTWDLITTMFNI